MEIISNDDPGSTLIDDRLDHTACGSWDDIWHGDRRDKDVGWMTVTTSPDNKKVTITIRDAYPCYYSHAFWYVNNYGSCPVQVYGYQLTKVSEAGHEVTVNVDLLAGHIYYVKVSDIGQG